MKVIVTSSEYRTPFSNNYFVCGKRETVQDFRIFGSEIDFDVRMISTNGFSIPDNCDVEVEMKFTFIPKTPKTETITLK